MSSSPSPIGPADPDPKRKRVALASALRASQPGTVNRIRLENALFYALYPDVLRVMRAEFPLESQQDLPKDVEEYVDFWSGGANWGTSQAIDHVRNNHAVPLDDPLRFALVAARNCLFDALDWRKRRRDINQRPKPDEGGSGRERPAGSIIDDLDASLWAEATVGLFGASWGGDSAMWMRLLMQLAMEGPSVEFCAEVKAVAITLGKSARDATGRAHTRDRELCAFLLRLANVDDVEIGALLALALGSVPTYAMRGRDRILAALRLDL